MERKPPGPDINQENMNWVGGCVLLSSTAIRVSHWPKQITVEPTILTVKLDCAFRFLKEKRANRSKTAGRNRLFMLCKILFTEYEDYGHEDTSAGINAANREGHFWKMYEVGKLALVKSNVHGQRSRLRPMLRFLDSEEISGMVKCFLQKA